MVDKIYYVKGSKENPEGVKQALLEVYPNAENIDVFAFNHEKYYYYAINDIIEFACDLPHILLLKHAGTELQPIVIDEKSIFRLPSKEEFEYLIDNFSKWDKENKGLLVENKEGDTLFLPADGYRSDTSGVNVGSAGNYWSSTVFECDDNHAYYIYFSSKSKYTHTSSCYFGYSIRLVSDAPFDGGIEFNGVWWKPENEEGYYTYEEAINKFNK